MSMILDRDLEIGKLLEKMCSKFLIEMYGFQSKEDSHHHASCSMSGCLSIVDSWKVLWEEKWAGHHSV